ncbi:hypothetical protein TrRE_jg13326 [Triparma retinervis]|uniref:Uncharacterized protein n=1 Tax=Triparma retinervis TaxID=2557542 RepID=A0A9W6ZGA6_9STRA|nr:hypothetical protein TrRE_jg13326 [Triparma retinervis]
MVKGLQEVKDFKKAMPQFFKSRNVTNGDYYVVVQGLEAYQQANPFINCPSLECTYWCCPLGPVQMCLCLLNPCTYCLYAKVRVKKKAFNEDIWSLMEKYNIKAEIREETSAAGEPFAIFYCDPL